MHWLQSLTPAHREKVYESMRELRRISEFELEESRKLQPRNGEIAIGSAHMYGFARGEALAEFLRALNAGSTPGQAVTKAKQMVSDIVRKWNESRAPYRACGIMGVTTHLSCEGFNSWLSGVVLSRGPSKK